MNEGGKKKKLAVLQFEFAGRFVDSTFAKQDDLPAGFQGATDGIPFFQCDLERNGPGHELSIADKESELLRL
jgi:hypothetical protein